jgi:sarcosine reductase
MKLELVSFPVKDVRFKGETRYHDQVLEISKEELLGMVLTDRRIVRAELDVAFPGEKTRIVRIRGIVEPRVKVSGPGCVFPGILGPVETVGDGKTHRLTGVAVTTSADYRPTVLSGTGAPIAGLLDMWGRGSNVTPFGSVIHIALVIDLAVGVTEVEAHAAIELAECKVASRLAETTKDKSSENVEVFELFKVDSDLPRVVYISTVLTEPSRPHSAVAFYGSPIRDSFPFFYHPNELLDGAVTQDARQGHGNTPTNWHWLNNPVVLKLLREHGKRVNFIGVIQQKTFFEAEHDKQAAAACASQMAKLLGADGAIITRQTASGANMEDVMLTVQACERKGIKTVLITPEHSGAEGTELPLMVYVPEATAMISTGSTDVAIQLPVPTKVIGSKKGEMVSGRPDEAPYNPWGELTLERWREITGSQDWLGNMNYTCWEY